MIYKKDKLAIVPFDRSMHMTDKYRSWFHDPDVTKYNQHGLFPYGRKAMDEFVRAIEERTNRIVWAIEVSGVHVGNISLQSINFINRSAELAIVIGEREAWGKGYATEAVRMVLEHAFVVIGLNRVWTGTAACNKSMQRVAEKAGFYKEGTFREGMWLRGDFVNVIAYGITAGEYDGLINRETIDEINALENLS